MAIRFLLECVIVLDCDLLSFFLESIGTWAANQQEFALSCGGMEIVLSLSKLPPEQL